MSRRPWSVSFGILLIATVLGLILLSTVSTTWLSAAGFRTVIREILTRQIEMTLDSVTERVEQLFEPAGRLVGTLSHRLAEERLPTDNPTELAAALADILRFEEGIAWLSFGYPDGRFAGAWTNGESLYINVSWPDAGPPMEWEIHSDGVWRRIFRPGTPESFDARKRPWFQVAVKTGQKEWTGPYEFASGGRGITVSEIVRAPDGRFLGVVTADFYLREIGRYLEKLQEEFRGDTLVFSVSGKLIATPSALQQDDAISRIRALFDQGVHEDALREGPGQLIANLNIGGESFIVGMKAAEIPGNLECVSAILFSRRVAFGPIEETIIQSALAALVALLLTLIVGYILARRIAGPLQALSRQLGKIGRFELDPEAPLRSPIREVSALGDAVERMRASLASFSRYVPVDLVRDLVVAGGVAEPGGTRRPVTVLFCDLAGFTAFSEKTDPEAAVDVLTEYFEGFAESVDRNGGVIDKFLGDGIMALFDAPRHLENPPAAACRAALEGREACRQHPAGLAMRVGIFSGEALVGNIGTEERFAYTAIGDCVNLASRLESLNKAYGTGILAGTGVRSAAGEEEFLWRQIDLAAVVGRDAPLEIHELVAFRRRASPEVRDRVLAYEKAFSAYLAKDLDEARTLLERLAHEDPPSRVLLDRIKGMLADPDHPGWQDTFRHTKK